MKELHDKYVCVGGCKKLNVNRKTVLGMKV